MRIFVIGAGVGGLAAAALLAKSGHQVTVLEKTSSPGGRARVWEKDGFVFDMGPSWYLMPEIFEHFFEIFGRKVEDFYKLIRLNPSYRIFFPDDVIDISADLEENKTLFGRLEKDGARKLEEYLKQAQIKYEYLLEGLMYKDLAGLRAMFSPKLIAAGWKLSILSNMEKLMSKYFSTERARKILQYSIVFLGGNPKNTPALYSMISHIDFNLGVWYPYGGLGKIVEATQELAVKYGADIRFETEVTRLVVEDKEVTRVITTKGEFEADIVVSNADYPHSEMDLLDREFQTYPKSYWEKKTIAPSAFVLYLGLNKKIESLTHHNVILDYDWVRHFEQIFEEPSWPDEPAYYLCCPSKMDDTVAPPDCENIFVTIPISPGIEDSPEIREAYFDKIIKHMEKVTGTTISDSIIVKRIFSLNDFSQDYNAYKGTAVGLTHTFSQSAFFRPRHRSKRVKNLFYTGQYTHPGIGVPMVLIASEIVANLINKEYGS
ncbi:MAG: phytoene desaturase family protein [Candidatus Thorarchaeota archaeon SMTZ1-45]|nr:MAG: phytoene dehydrogenase [Candidatus Thorarchaeota archaeon SMTZ1-45]